MFRFIILFGLALSSGQALAQSQHECSGIALDSDRLSCFDAAFPASEAGTSSTSEAFTVFRDLVSSDLDPERGARRVFLDKCWLFDVSFRGKSENGLKLQGMASAPLPEGKRFYVTSDFWVMLVNLREVDLTSTTRKGQSTQIVMRRGSEVRYAGVKQHLRGDLFYLGFKTSEDGIKVSDLQEKMISGILDLPQKPNLWEALVADPREIQYQFFRATDGVVDENYRNMEFTQKAFSVRSVDWNFSFIWPEDAAKIHTAFTDLARSCQG